MKNRRATLAAAAAGWLMAASTGLAQSPAARPAVAPERLSPEVLSLLCAPRAALEEPAAQVRIAGSQDTVTKDLYARGDTLVLDGGTNKGLAVGQEYYVRRVVRSFGQKTPTMTNPAILRTLGWIQVQAVGAESALASVVYGCDALDRGDFVEPFTLPAPPPAPSTAGQIQYDKLGRILFGDEGRGLAGGGSLMVIDRGSDHGIAAGDSFVVLRDKRAASALFTAPRGQEPLTDIGEAVAVAVRPDSSTILIFRARDAIMAGDFVAIRR